MSTSTKDVTRAAVAEQLYEAYMVMFTATHDSLLDLVRKDATMADFLSDCDQRESKSEFIESVMQLDESKVAELRDVLSDCQKGEPWANRITNRMFKTLQRSS